MSIEVLAPNDEYLDSLRRSLTAPAVLKAELAAVKSSCRVSKVFAYEGITDKVVYSQWITKILPELDYEPFICRNKNQLLQLFDSLQNDLNGLSDNVYFFVDRDFDDLKGRAQDQAIFMTEKYAVENYLVCSEILTDLLRVEFHCHGSPDVRARVVSLFDKMYDQFLEHTSDVNFRIYMARKLNIKQTGDLPSRLGELALVNFDSITPGRGELRNIVPLEREPSDIEVAKCKEEFDKLDRRSRFRGKFALLFFTKWLSLLLEERNAKNSKFFEGLPQGDFVAKGPFSFETLASRSKPPVSLQNFLAPFKQLQGQVMAM